MIVSIRKASWGLMPANRQTEELVAKLGNGDLIEAKLIEDTRSLNQNRLYWLWVSEIGKATGHTKDDLHERFKKHYALPILLRDDPDLQPFIDRVQGLGTDAYDEFVRRYISTTDLSVKQFTEMLNEIEVDARTRGIDLTRPEDLYWQALEKAA